MSGQCGDTRPSPAASAPADANAKDAAHAPIPSALLLKGRDMISIDHNGQLYQLRKTRQDKLILTK